MRCKKGIKRFIAHFFLFVLPLLFEPKINDVYNLSLSVLVSVIRISV